MNKKMCDRCPIADICRKEKKVQSSILQYKEVVRPRLEDYCPLEDIVKSQIGKQAWMLAEVANNYQVYYGDEEE